MLNTEMLYGDKSWKICNFIMVIFLWNVKQHGTRMKSVLSFWFHATAAEPFVPSKMVWR
jgi:hypothetical protein